MGNQKKRSRWPSKRRARVARSRQGIRQQDVPEVSLSEVEVNQDSRSDSDDQPLAAVRAKRKLGNAVDQFVSIDQHAIAEPRLGKAVGQFDSVDRYALVLHPVVTLPEPSFVGPTVAIRSSFR